LKDIEDEEAVDKELDGRFVGGEIEVVKVLNSDDGCKKPVSRRREGHTYLNAENAHEAPVQHYAHHLLNSRSDKTR
jgi:hypothetical protein